MIHWRQIQFWGTILNLGGIAGSAWALFERRAWFPYCAAVWMAGLFLRFAAVPWAKAVEARSTPETGREEQAPENPESSES